MAAIVHVAAVETVVEPIGMVQVVVFPPCTTVKTIDAPATTVSDRTDATIADSGMALGNRTLSTTPTTGNLSKAVQATIATSPNAPLIDP